MEDKNNVWESILTFLAGAYILMSQIMTVVFMVGYCKSDDSIAKIIFIDTWLAELKGWLWIFFIW
jgi:hydrogenase-4 membrane subunit HyfE